MSIKIQSIFVTLHLFFNIISRGELSMNISNLSGSNLIAIASSLAILISQDLSADEIGVLAAFFTALGDNLAILAINKNSN